MNIRTFGSRSSLFSLVELQRLYDRTFTRINKHIDRGDGQSIPQRFVSNRWHFEMGWERIDGEHDRLVNFTMLKKIFLGLEGIHAKTDTPLVLVYRKPLRFFIEEWNGSQLIIPGRGWVLSDDTTESEVGGEVLFNNGSRINSSVLDS